MFALYGWLQCFAKLLDFTLTLCSYLGLLIVFQAVLLAYRLYLFLQLNFNYLKITIHVLLKSTYYLILFKYENHSKVLHRRTDTSSQIIFYAFHERYIIMSDRQRGSNGG